MRRRAGSAGLLAPARAASLVRVVGLTPLLLASQILAWTAESALAVAAAAIACGIVAVQLGFVAHDAGHGAVSRSRRLNQAVGHLAFTIVNGLGFQSWRLSHAAHHAHCQDESKDPDMWVDTLISLTPRSASHKVGIGRRLKPFQGLYLWPIATLFAHGLRIQSLSDCCSELRRFRQDAIGLAVHYLFWFVAPMWLLGTGFFQAVAVYGVASAVVGVYLAVLFWVNHVGMPVLQADHGLTALEQQVEGTRNVRNPPILDFLFGGLNFQIEHHLLPSCPSMRLRRLQMITRPLCRARSLSYREEPFGGALVSVTRHIFQIARADRDPGTCD